MDSRIEIGSLMSLSILKGERTERMNNLIFELKKQDVEDNVRYADTLARIKKQVLVATVKIYEPILTHKPSERDAPPNYGRDMGKQKIHLVSVRFGFDGSSDLFKYCTSGTFKGMYIYQPTAGKLIVTLEQTELNKEDAISVAKGKLEGTQEIIAANNKDIADWNNSIISVIEDKMKKHREELLAF